MVWIASRFEPNSGALICSMSSWMICENLVMQAIVNVSHAIICIESNRKMNIASACSLFELSSS